MPPGAVAKTPSEPKIKFKQNPSQDGHRFVKVFN